jgi:hypothetical protein
MKTAVSNSTDSIHTTSNVSSSATLGGRMFIQRKKERRGSKGRITFPLVTDRGDEVEEDRRCIPDRRLGNIQVEQTELGRIQFSL